MAFLPIASPVQCVESAQTYLCVEIGGTNIKACSLPSELTIDRIKKITTITFSSTSWLNKNLPQLLKNSPENPLLTQIHGSFSQISISITGAVFENSRYFDGRRRGIPENLKEACQKEASCNVTVENDAICFAKGTLEYLKLQSKTPDFPCLVITLGTGIGLALAKDEKSVCGIEVSFIDCPYTRLKPLTSEQPLRDHRWSAHSFLGARFFEWISTGPALEEDALKKKYSERFYAFVDDIKEFVQETFFNTVASIVVGGGNSQFLEPSKENPLPITLLSPAQLDEWGLAPNLIQLIGCHSSCTKEYAPSQIYPCYEEMELRLKEGRFS